MLHYAMTTLQARCCQQRVPRIHSIHICTPKFLHYTSLITICFLGVLLASPSAMNVSRCGGVPSQGLAPSFRSVRKTSKVRPAGPVPAPALRSAGKFFLRALHRDWQPTDTTYTLYKRCIIMYLGNASRV